MKSTRLFESFELLNEKKRRNPEEFSHHEMGHWKDLRRQIEMELFGSAPDPARDTRHFLRVPASIPARHHVDDEARALLVSVLGEGGLFAQTASPLSVGSETVLQLLPGRGRAGFEVLGLVVWNNPHAEPRKRGMGMQFVGLSDHQREVIYGMVDDLLIQHLLARRRFAYLDARLKVDFVHAQVHHALVSNRLSVEGVFLATDERVPVGTRLHLDLTAPDGRRCLQVLCEVHRQVEAPEPGEPAGLEVHFVNLEERDRRTIRELMEDRIAGKTATHASERRAHARVERQAKIRYRTADWYGTALANDLSAGGVFIRTPRLAPVGTELTVTLFHPVRLKHLALNGTVVRRIPVDPDRPELVPGVAVEFKRIEDEVRGELREFLRDFAFEPTPCQN